MTYNNHIKRTFIYALLCVYALGLLKPIVPVVNDAIAHTFYKLEHISTVHYEDGKYHLHAELEQEANDMKKEAGNTVPSSAYEALSNHINNDMFKINSYFTISQIINSYKTQVTLGVLTKISTPPPQVA
jgi:UDP-N-acetylglucosamine:LPS N-acetylglucosamine transferase